MQAPNKVYILPSQYNLQYDNGGEEYICKEALLEWAKGQICNLEKSKASGFIGTQDISITTIEGLIKHIESL